MNVTICSAFRNASAFLPRYFAQVGALRAQLMARGDKLALVVGEGDSTDDTSGSLYAALVDGQYEATLLDVTHKGPHFGSIEHPQRFRQLAYVWNELWSALQASADVVAIVESDLIWKADVIVRLIDHVQNYVAVAPMVMDGPESFYDVFAFRTHGKRFAKQAPYHACFDSYERLYKLDSAGSVLVMDGDLARKVRFTDEEAIVGLCANIYAVGGSIWLDTGASVCHP